jgi:L-iditol 2-dehydrogenase
MAGNQDNLTAVLYGIEDLKLEQRPIPQIKDDGEFLWKKLRKDNKFLFNFTEVLLEMDCVGICGSDVHYLVHGRIGDFIVKAPMIVGHESSGIVVKKGSKVSNLAIGDRVAIEPGVSCRYCDFCKSGKYNLCKEMKFCATPPYDGNLTKFYAHASDFCYKLPDHVSMEEAALLEPLSVGVHACRRANIGIESVVLILGAGPIGLVTLLTAKAMGARVVIITDLVQNRLDVAKKLGADHTVLIGKNESEADLVKRVQSVAGVEPDKSIDCGGFEATNRLAMMATRSGGCVVIVGCGPPEVKLPMVSACSREVDIRGVFRYSAG